MKLPMKISMRWDEKLHFTATGGKHSVGMDTQPPLGSDLAQSPKQLVISGLCGCTAMDVISFLKKHHEVPETFEVDAEVSTTEGVYPAVFTSALLVFRLQGPLTPGRVLEAVELSQTRYCGVSAMLVKAFPIHYVVYLNGKEIGTGAAQF